MAPAVRLTLDQFLSLGLEITRQRIVKRASYEGQWMPMASGNELPESILFALEGLWVNATVDHNAAVVKIPWEEELDGSVVEGAKKTVIVNAYERDPDARARCIRHWGEKCCVCDFDFASTYGEIGDGYIHVHHLSPLSEIGGEYELNPEKDLRPVCPNCHAMLHRVRPALSIEALKQAMEQSLRRAV